jgi:hypothetical protein
VAVGGEQLERVAGDVDAAGHGKRLDVAEAQRPRPLDVVVGVEIAQPARRVAHLGLQPRRGGLADPERRLGERQAAEHVVEVAVGREQAGQAPAHLRQELADPVELLLEDRRVDDERLVARVQQRARGLPLDARGHDDVPVQGQDLHGGRALEPEEADGLEERLDLLGRLLHPRLEGLLAAVDPDDGDLELQERLDVVVVVGRDVDPALLAAHPARELVEVRGVGLVGAHLLGGDHQVVVAGDVPARLAEELVVDVRDQARSGTCRRTSELRRGLLERRPARDGVRAGSPAREGSRGQPISLAIFTATWRSTSA